MDLLNTTKTKETAVLVGVHTGSKDVLNDCNDETIDELALLAQTAGAEVVGRFIQNRPAVENATYIGEGKAEEIKHFCQDNEVDLVIFDDELTGTQVRNLERMLDLHVIDRSALIMDIFASRANTREGKLQVELAQLQYFLPRLTGSFVHLSRLGGGIGTRGPGETKLESDRRHIRNRISVIKGQLKEVEKNRTVQRRQRFKEGVAQIALVGYTNAGKSTLLNALTDAGVLAEDKLFATLDPTARKLMLPDGTQALLIDTVGFIRKLPHHLIKAFRSTLEEATLADVLVHVVDGTSRYLEDQMEVVERLLDELDAGNKPTLTVYNKADLIEDLLSLPSRNDAVAISAKTGENTDELLQALCRLMPEQRKRVRVVVPYSQGALVAKLYDVGRVHAEEHTAEGTLLDVTLDSRGYGLVRDFLE